MAVSRQPLVGSGNSWDLWRRGRRFIIAWWWVCGCLVVAVEASDGWWQCWWLHSLGFDFGFGSWAGLDSFGSCSIFLIKCYFCRYEKNIVVMIEIKSLNANFSLA